MADELSPIEELATKMGWNPAHDDSSGRPFVSAEDFILRSREIQKTMSNQLSTLSKTNQELIGGMKQLKDHYTKLTKTEVARLKKDISALKEQRDAAIEDGNKDKVREIDSQLTEMETFANDAASSIEASASQNQPGGNGQSDELSPAAKQWLAENPWYETDKEMKAYADAQAEYFRGLPDDKYFKALTARVRGVYPDRFQTTQKRPPAVEGQSLRPGKKGHNKFTYNDLNEDQRKWAQFYKKQGVMEVQEYVDELARIGELG